VNNRYSLTERLAQHLLRPVDAETRSRSRLHLLDWLGCVAGARHSAVAATFATMQGSALIPATFLGNVLEMDDVHRAALLHPGPVIWPAVLGGLVATDDMIGVAVRGYEAMIVVGATFDPRQYAHYHPTATAGVFGAAAATAIGLGADEHQLAHALALSGSVAGGVWQTRHDDNMAKAWHVAHAVETGASAAFHALHGVTGPRHVLEGPQGLYAAMTDAPKPMTFGDGWRIAEVSFKPWAACRHCHPAIDAALELRARGQLAPPFRIETYADAIAFCDRPVPTTEAQAKFSLQHSIAVIAAGREATCADFTPAAIADPVIACLREQVTVEVAADSTARYPAHFGARVTSAGGSITLVDTRGDPERPLDADGVITKARSLFAWGGVTNGEAAIVAALDGNDPVTIIRLLDGWLA
jgi:2-methylcitrate dehydratase PrpD